MIVNLVIAIADYSTGLTFARFPTSLGTVGYPYAVVGTHDGTALRL